METVNQAANTPTAGEQQPTGRTFTQDEVNTIIADRLNRERTKYADYDDLKAKASQADSLQAQLDSRNRADMLARVSAATGVPVDLIQGETEEECTEQAKKIAKFAKPAYPILPGGGEPRHLPSMRQGPDGFSPDYKHKPKEYDDFLRKKRF